MTDAEKDAAAHLTGSQKDDVSAYYCHATLARRRRLRRSAAWRRAVCHKCLGPRKSLKSQAAPNVQCQECHATYIRNRAKELHANHRQFTARPAVLILG